jgi:hypothetical protein
VVFPKGNWLSGTVDLHINLIGPNRQSSVRSLNLWRTGLWDSPIALLTWIREKLQTWSDSYPWTDREIITWVMIYWVSEVTGGLRIYKQGNVPKLVSSYVHVPFGVSVFPKEMYVAPKGNLNGKPKAEILDWAPLVGDLRFYRTHESGG